MKMILSTPMVTVVIFGFMLLVMTTGLPLTFALGVTGMFATFLLWGPEAMASVYLNAFGVAGASILVALPLFIFMGIMLQKSGIADDLYQMIYVLMGGVRGGLAMGTVAICAIIAAMVGISGAATVAMGIIALPSMLERGYDKQMVTGCIQAGGALGFLIPPSVLMIMFGFLGLTSPGRLFAGGLLPGIMLAILYIIYIGVRCYFQPHLGPARAAGKQVNWREKAKALRALILPGVLIFSVLGLIFMGVTSITEASAVGAFGAVVCAAIHRRLNWRILHECLMQTVKLMGMVMWIMVSAAFFSKIYIGLGAPVMLRELIVELGANPYLVLTFFLLSFFIMGMFLDDTAILFITVPLYVPLIVSLGFDKVWFGILFILSMQTAFLTPPFGYNLFYMKAIVPPEITLVDIYRSIIPFVILQTIGLILVVVFPQIALFIPSLVFGGA